MAEASNVESRATFGHVIADIDLSGSISPHAWTSCSVPLLFARMHAASRARAPLYQASRDYRDQLHRAPVRPQRVPRPAAHPPCGVVGVWPAPEPTGSWQVAQTLDIGSDTHIDMAIDRDIDIDIDISIHRPTDR